MAIEFRSNSQIKGLPIISDEGGEAVIYDYNNTTVLKIYRNSVDLNSKEIKVNYFIQIKNKLPKNVIGPEEIVTVNGRFVGYAMKKIVNCEDLYMLINQSYLSSTGLTNKDVLQAITNLGVNLNMLHSIGVIVGDINSFNFQIVGTDIYFIDVDSWGIKGKFNPDTHTPLYTCPDSYKSNGDVTFSIADEQYNFAILAFNILTQIHPFAGTYLPEQGLSIPDRMKRKISILGQYKSKIKIPKFIKKWSWMSPELIDDFIKIFENGKKFDITPRLQFLLQNMQYCSNHNIFYYSKYSRCPICDEHASVKTAPVITKVTQTANGPQITLLFTSNDSTYIFNNVHYLNNKREAVHFTTGRTFTIPAGNRVDFSNNGNYVYVADNNTIQIYDLHNRKIATLSRKYKSYYLVKDQTLYYVDTASNLIKLTVTERGNIIKRLTRVYNPLFEATDDGKVFSASLYPKKAVIITPDYTFEVPYTGKINEYTIKYDNRTHKWLFVYQLPNGKFRTLLFNKNVVEYDDDIIMYNAQTLSNIDFINNTIYDPADNKIIGINLIKNTAKEFPCSVVDESSRLKFTGRGFQIINKTKIYNYS